MILYQNITNSEYYRLHGKLTPERIEKLLEIEEEYGSEAEFDSLYDELRSKLYNLQELLDHSTMDEIKDNLNEILNRS